MSFESLSHTPEFQLPDYVPQYTEDLRGLIEECHEGLHRVVINKMIRRGKYEQIATITCQEKGTKKTHPDATADEIAEYAMGCIQYEIEKSDAPGTYKVTLFGAPGKGRFERSKHIDMTDGENAKDVKLIKEEDLLEQMRAYIGELQEAAVAKDEMITGLFKEVLNENKQMLKIVGDSQRQLAEVEALRAKHSLEMSMHKDEMKMRELEEEMKQERWKEFKNMVEETGAPKALSKVLIKKFKEMKIGRQEEDRPEEKKKVAASVANAKKKLREPETKKKLPEGKKLEVKSDGGNNKKKKKKKCCDNPRFKKISDTEKKCKNCGKVKKRKKKLSPLKSEEELLKEAEALVESSPLLMAAEGLKFTIDEANQWDELEEILSKEQFEIFKEIGDCKSDDEVKVKLDKLMDTNNVMNNLMELGEKISEEQQIYLEPLVDYIADDDDD